MKQTRVTASMFYKFASCPHWVYFDAYGDKKKMAKTPKFAEMLLKNGVLHEEEMLRGLSYARPEGATPAARAKDTLRLMKEGVERIYHGVLITPDMIGEPDLLERRNDAPSDLGEYYYVPVDIKSAEKLSDAHRYQLSCYADLLGATQGRHPAEGCIINGSGTRTCFALAEFDEQYREALAAIRTELDGDCPPPHLSSGCKQSPWFSQCKALAEKHDDIALLYNVKKKAVVALREAGVRTVHEAALIDPETFPKNRYLKRELLDRIVVQARALIEKKHVLRRKFILPAPPLELFFDIEGDPLRQVEYLFGFLTRDKDGREAYVTQLAERPEDEGAMWNAFLEFIAGLPKDYAVYHYGSYEVARLSMLEARHGGSKSLERFRDRMIDLNEIVKECVVFPLYFYGIKDIGKYVGFEREGKIVGGGESVAFYEDWLATGKRKWLTDILLYNEEDVIATRFLKDWLAHELEKAHAEMGE
ncbi:MAG: hypothetical protein RLZZ324_600 [Candidatus Parcubacteria bacterium]|jgi:uncharacterized protein